MIPKSPAFDAAINANTRTSDFNAQFSFIPPGVVEGAVVTATNPASYADPDQLTDDNNQMSAYWRNLGDWPLDGSTVPIDGSGEIGYWSSVLSAADGSVAGVAVTLTLDDDYDIPGLTVAFDQPGGEYATEFTVEYFDSGGSSLASLTVTDNTEALTLVNLTAVGVAKIVLTINAWCLPNSRPRLAEMVPGQIYEFGLDNSYGLTASNVITPFANNFETGEMVLTFDNSDAKFDFLNPAGLFSYLRRKMKISSEVGILISGVYDYTPAGDRYLYEISNQRWTSTAELVCRPSVAFVGGEYTRVLSATTVAAMAAALWSQADIPDGYTIDASLQGLTVNAYIGENVRLSDALADLAIAAGGYWKVNRDGSYELLPITAALAAPVASLSYDDMLSKPQITQNPEVTAVKIGYSYVDLNQDFKSLTTIWTNGANDGTEVSAISVYTPTAARAEAIGQLVLDYHAARRLSFSIQYRGNPAFEVGDVISIETDYGFHDIEITEISLTLDGDGFLRGTIKGVG